VEPRRRARAFVLGVLADLPRKNCWSIAEQAADATPDGMQHLLAQAMLNAWPVQPRRSASLPLASSMRTRLCSRMGCA